MTMHLFSLRNDSHATSFTSFAVAVSLFHFFIGLGVISKKKWGFTVNPYLQFKKDLKDVAENILTPDFVAQQGIFNYKYIKRILDYPAHPKLRWHYNYIWIVLGMAMWEKMFIEGDIEKKDFNLRNYYN